MRKVKENDTVVVHYKGTLKDGQVFDSSEGKEPLEVELGKGRFIPGFEKGLLQMEVNQKKTITIPSEEAYGEVREDLFLEIKKKELPDNLDPEEGMGLVAKSADGKERQLRVTEVKKDHIVVDANHPLAGQDLVFDLELLAIH